MFLADSLSGEDVDLTKSDDENTCDSGVKLRKQLGIPEPDPDAAPSSLLQKYLILDQRWFNKDQNLVQVSTKWQTFKMLSQYISVLYS